MKKIMYFLCLSLTYISCSNKIKYKAIKTVPIININVNEIKSNSTYRLSEIFENIEMISLETIEESIIKRIDKIEIYGENIYILDSEGAKALMVFSLKGKFKYKIGKQGHGPGEFVIPQDFDICNHCCPVKNPGQI